MLKDEVKQMIDRLEPVVIICGHYGVGKTNFSVNLSIDAARTGRAVTLIDLDVVNPYFRSSDYTALLTDAGVKVVSPEFAGTALDAPMLSGQIETSVASARNEAGRMTIIDVGGDDAGATALGRFSRVVGSGKYSMLYLVNAFREQTTEPAAAVSLLPEIESQAHLTATAVVNNSHLQSETVARTIEQGRAFAREVAQAAGLPLFATTIPDFLEGVVECDESVQVAARNSEDAVHSASDQTLPDDSAYYVKAYVRTPWDLP